MYQRAGVPADPGRKGLAQRIRYAGGIASKIQRVQLSADRLIVDETGLEGSFEWTLTYAPAFVPERLRASTLPELFTALREQLGLTLEPRRARMEVRVIDAVSMPEPN